MNNDYIKREDILGNQDDDKMVDIINYIPAADVEFVRYGRWIPGKAVYSKYDEGRLVARYYDQWMCSVCNYVINDRPYSRISYKRCPECGAKMMSDDEIADGIGQTFSPD